MFFMCTTYTSLQDCLLQSAEPNHLLVASASLTQINHSYPQNSIFVMDETACWMDMSSDTTVALRGCSI